MSPIEALGFVLTGAATLEALGYLLLRHLVPPRKRQLLQYLLSERNAPTIPSDATVPRSAIMRYSPHPFTSFEPNPSFVNHLGLKIHNNQSFRDDLDYTDDFLKISDLRIYLAGGSTVYDTMIDDNRHTFANVLQNDLESKLAVRVKVINGGVGNWTSLQSFIRLSCWIDYLQPHIVVVYQGINDITPFLYTMAQASQCRPDFSHAITPFNISKLLRKIPPLARHSKLLQFIAAMNIHDEDINIRFYTLQGDYKVHHIGDDTDFAINHIAERIRYDFIETHYHNLIAICKMRDIDVVFMTERLAPGDEWYRPFLDRINDIIRGLDRFDNCHVYDFDALFPHSSEFFEDSMHFNSSGNQLRSEMISQFLQQIYHARNNHD